MRIRWKQIWIALFTMISAGVANLSLLPLSSTEKGIITFICLVILSLNHSVLETKKE